MAPLLLIDVDGTLISTPAVVVSRHIRSPFSPLSRWQRLVAATDYPPVPEAVAALVELAGIRIEIVTARAELLRAATVRAITTHFPALTSAPLHLCAGDSNKAMKLADLARADGAVVIDNDPAIASALPASCTFYLAPRDWSAAVADARGRR